MIAKMVMVISISTDCDNEDETQEPPLEAWHGAGSGLGEERGSFGASRRFFQVSVILP